MYDHNLPSVLMFGWEFHPFNSGGLGVACAGLSKALSASGVPLTFVLPWKVPLSASWCRFAFANDEKEIKNSELMKDLYSGYQSQIKEKNSSVSGLPISVSGGLVERVVSYALKAPEIAKKYNHSIIHAHDWLSFPAGIAAKRVSGKPLVVHVHATEFDRGGSNSVNQDIYNIEREGFQKADLIVTVSERTRRGVIHNYNVSPSKVKVVYNGIDFNQQQASIPENLAILKKSGNNIVLFVGRITLQKGPDYFVSMAEKVLENQPDTYFVVSGSGDLEGQMLSQVAQKGLSHRFIFCGFLRGEELLQIYKAADIFVMPSVSEPFGLVPLEAMMADVPVLVSKESGVSEILNHALKAHFWDIDDMADKVLSVLSHKKLKNQLSLSGKSEVKTIHWKKAADSLISLYNELDHGFGMFLFPSTPAFEGAKVPSL